MKNMIKWTDDYCLGVDLIDEQHQQLFEIANRIFSLLENEFIIDKQVSIII